MAANPPPLMVQKFSLVTLYDEKEDEKNPVVLLQVSRRSALSKWLDTVETVAYAEVIAVQKSRDSESIQLTLAVEADEKKRQYRVRVPFSWLRTANMFTHHADCPLFLIATDDAEYNSTTVYNTSDFDCLVVAPDGEESQAEALDTIINEHTTGKPDMGVTLDEFNETRSKVLEIVMSLINGDPQAIKSASDLIAPYNRLEAASKQATWKPVSAEKKLALIKTHLDNLLAATNPASMSSQLMGSVNHEEHMTDIATFEQLMTENGLDGVFAADGSTAPVSQLPQDQVAYLARPLTLLPKKMSHLSGKMGLFTALEKPWQAAQQSDNLITDGDDLAAAFVVVATRLGRMEELVIDNSVHIHPMIVLGHGMTTAGEPMNWVLRETLKLLAVGQALPFNDFLESEMLEADSVEEQINSVLGFLMHRFGHQVMDEDEWDRDSLRLALRNQPLMENFVQELYEQAAEVQGGGEHNRDTPCPVINAVFAFLRVGFTPADVVAQFGQALVAVGDMHAVRENLAQGLAYQQGSTEWINHVQAYLLNLVEIEAE